ncbi:MAG: helix-turn-helix transcriptional regulator [Clostridia bacterium]|nr:helix-turn-helix transcriptional regulator [Clostridia bacterium]
MTTVGQRIKTFRTAGDITQAELAGKLGVSVQTVSKWECDTGMPDIIQIVPLAQILGVSADAILGVDGDEQGYIDEVLGAFREKWGGKKVSRYDPEQYYDMFTTFKGILKRYPMNYLVAIECVRRGRRILRLTVHDHIKAPDGCNISHLYRDLKKIARSIIDYDTDLWRKAEAKKELIICHYIMGNDEEAEAEFEGLPPKEEYDTLVSSAIVRNDRAGHIEAAKKKFSHSVWDLQSAFWHLANAYSVCGAEKREEAKEIIKKEIDIFESLEGFMDEESRLDRLRFAWIHLGKQYLRDGDFDDVINCAEKLTELCEKHYNNAKDNTGEGKYFDRSVVKFGMEIFDREENYSLDLLKLYDECADLEGNPVVTDPRFKACKARLEALK